MGYCCSTCFSPKWDWNPEYSWCLLKFLWSSPKIKIVNFSINFCVLAKFPLKWNMFLDSSFTSWCMLLSKLLCTTKQLLRFILQCLYANVYSGLFHTSATVSLLRDWIKVCELFNCLGRKIKKSVKSILIPLKVNKAEFSALGFFWTLSKMYQQPTSLNLKLCLY